MKIAICLRGLVGHSTSTTDTSERMPLDPKIGFDLHNLAIIQPNVINGHQVDIFMHCWNEGQEQQLLEYYKPKKYLIEKQEQFETVRTVEAGFRPQDVRREFALKSVFSSTKKVIELKKEVELEQNFIYDAVILLRYDVGFNPKVVELNIEDYDMKYFYSNYNEDYGLNPQLLKSHIVDYWFMSNSSWMDKYSKLHDIFPTKYNNLINKKSKRGGLQSAHQIQMDHINTFAKERDRKTILGSPSIVFCRNPEQLPTDSDPIGKKRIKWPHLWINSNL
jgi:hypothetical protein